MTLTPTLFGRLDNFQSFNFGNKVNDYGIKMQAYFVPPTDGKYQFILVADDVGKLYISSSEDEEEKILRIDGIKELVEK